MRRGLAQQVERACHIDLGGGDWIGTAGSRKDRGEMNDRADCMGLE